MITLTCRFDFKKSLFLNILLPAERRRFAQQEQTRNKLGTNMKVN